MVLLTDGNQTGIDIAPDQTPLSEAIQPIKNLGTKVIAIGIGSVDREQLKVLVDKEDDILIARGFDELFTYVQETVGKSCRGMSFCTQSLNLFIDSALNIAIASIFRTIETD